MLPWEGGNGLTQIKYLCELSAAAAPLLVDLNLGQLKLIHIVPCSQCLTYASGYCTQNQLLKQRLHLMVLHAICAAGEFSEHLWHTKKQQFGQK